MIVKFDGIEVTNFEENIEETKNIIKELDTLILTLIPDATLEAYDVDIEVEIITNDNRADR